MKCPKHPVAFFCILVVLALSPIGVIAWLSSWKAAIVALISSIVITAIIYGLVALIGSIGRHALENDLAQRRAEYEQSRIQREKRKADFRQWYDANCR